MSEKKETNFVNVICPKCRGNRFLNKNKPCNRCFCTGSILVDEEKFNKLTKNREVKTMNMINRKGESIEVKMPLK